MAQLPTDAPISYDASDHNSFHNELAAIANELDPDIADDGDILILDTGAWDAQTPAEAGLSEVGHSHVEADISDLDYGAAQVVSGTYAPTAGDTVLICDTSGGACTINLPSVDSFGNQALLIIQHGANGVTINVDGSDDIWTDGSTASSVSLASNGARWSGVAAATLDEWVSIS